jgi:hypothetical protein
MTANSYSGVLAQQFYEYPPIQIMDWGISVSFWAE